MSGSVYCNPHQLLHPVIRHGRVQFCACLPTQGIIWNLRQHPPQFQVGLRLQRYNIKSLAMNRRSGFKLSLMTALLGQILGGCCGLCTVLFLPVRTRGVFSSQTIETIVLSLGFLSQGACSPKLASPLWPYGSGHFPPDCYTCQFICDYTI